MKNSDILKYIESPELLKDADVKHFKKLVKEYPYFQIAHILLLKSLKNQNNDDFERQLSESSVYISDRDLLFSFLNREYKSKRRIDKKESQISETKEIKDQSLSDNNEKDTNKTELLKNKNVKRKINDSFEGMGENISETISSQLEFSVFKENDKLQYPSEIYFIEEEREGKNNIITIDADPDEKIISGKKKDILQIEEVKKAKKQSVNKVNNEINEIFELIKTEKIDKKISVEKQNKNGYFNISDYADEKNLSLKDDLISKFIQQNPRIKPNEIHEENIDISEESAKEDSHLLSETLVKVYIKQGLFEKAIQSYGKLSLKYPEKSTYFAGQIKILEEKINKQ